MPFLDFNPLWLWSFAIVVVAVWNSKRRRESSSKLPLPPGPPALPIIGNLLDIPTKNMEQVFYNLNKKYGM